MVGFFQARGWRPRNQQYTSTDPLGPDPHPTRDELCLVRLGELTACRQDGSLRLLSAVAHHQTVYKIGNGQLYCLPRGSGRSAPCTASQSLCCSSSLWDGGRTARLP
jgi:hypothetical protein